MKNLKKLSVVLFATLLSFNFTSCIEDGVSDAVDQVYLAQAEFLRAQAALQEAKAQWQLSDAIRVEAVAQYQLALAEVELAYARETDANTAQIEARTADIIAAAAYLAATNAFLLIEKQAELDIYLVELEEDLAEAQSALAVTMLELSEAIADAKNDMIRDLYGTYTQKMQAADGLHNTRLVNLIATAKQKLYLVSPGDDVTMAFAMAELVGTLADLEAGMAASYAEIARLEGLDPSQPQEDISALRADSLAIVAQWNDLGVDMATLENEKDAAKEAWLGANGQAGELLAMQGLIDGVQGYIDDHNDDIDDANDAIDTANDNIAAIPAAETALAAVDTTTAYNGIMAAMQVIEDKEDLLDDAEDDVDDAEDAYDDAYDAWEAADNALNQANGLGSAAIITMNADLAPFVIFPWPSGLYSQILEWEFMYTETQAALDAYSPGVFTIAQLETMLADADTEEQAAQAAWEADPAGLIVTDSAFPNDDQNPPVAAAQTPAEIPYADKFVNDEIGDATDAVPTSYLEVATWQLAGGFYYPDTYTNAAPEDIVPPAAAPVLSSQEFDDTNSNLIVVPDFATDKYYVEVERDDVSISTYQNLLNARAATWLANTNLIIANGGLTDATAVRDYAKAKVVEAYEALGYTYPTGVGTPDFSDVLVSQAYLAAAKVARDNAEEAWHGLPGQAYVAYPGVVNSAYMASSRGLVWNAEKAVADAKAALGVDFRPAADTNEFTDLFYQWMQLDTSPDLISYPAVYTVYGPGLGEYEQYEGPVSLTETDRIQKLPHEGTSITAYEALRNAYFEVVWKMEELEALQTVDYASIDNEYTGTGSNGDIDPNDKTIAEATADIADITLLLPSHELALAELEARLVVLMADFNLDGLLFDPGDHVFTVNIDGTNYTNLGYIPLLADYLNAIIAEDDLEAEMDALETELGYIGNVIDHVQLYLLGSATTFPTGDDIASFEVWRADAITDQMELIHGDGALDGFIKDIEQAEVDIELGKLDKETAERAVAELERELEVLDNKISILEGTAADILARIEALMN